MSGSTAAGAADDTSGDSRPKLLAATLEKGGPPPVFEERPRSKRLTRSERRRRKKAAIAAEQKIHAQSRVPKPRAPKTYRKSQEDSYSVTNTHSQRRSSPRKRPPRDDRSVYTRTVRTLDSYTERDFEELIDTLQWPSTLEGLHHLMDSYSDKIKTRTAVMTNVEDWFNETGVSLPLLDYSKGRSMRISGLKTIGTKNSRKKSSKSSMKLAKVSDSGQFHTCSISMLHCDKQDGSDDDDWLLYQEFMNNNDCDSHNNKYGSSSILSKKQQKSLDHSVHSFADIEAFKCERNIYWIGFTQSLISHRVLDRMVGAVESDIYEQCKSMLFEDSGIQALPSELDSILDRCADRIQSLLCGDHSILSSGPAFPSLAHTPSLWVLESLRSVLLASFVSEVLCFSIDSCMLSQCSHPFWQCLRVALQVRSLVLSELREWNANRKAKIIATVTAADKKLASSSAESGTTPAGTLSLKKTKKKHLKVTENVVSGSSSSSSSSALSKKKKKLSKMESGIDRVQSIVPPFCFVVQGLSEEHMTRHQYRILQRRLTQCTAHLNCYLVESRHESTVLAMQRVFGNPSLKTKKSLMNPRSMGDRMIVDPLLYLLPHSSVAGYAGELRCLKKQLIQLAGIAISDLKPSSKSSYSSLLSKRTKVDWLRQCNDTWNGLLVNSHLKKLLINR